MKHSTMNKIAYLFCICAATCTLVHGIGDMGKGKWSTVSVDQCEEGEEPYPCTIDVTRRKYNRTLDVFDVELNCDTDIDDTFAILITICKHVDGGCKEWQVLSDDSLPRFAHKYAESNIKRGFQMAALDPEDFPIKAGKHSMKDFALDYCEFPKDCVYGRFTAEAYILQAGRKMACLLATIEFDEDTEGYECD